MRLLFKQRMFSWFHAYDIYDDAGNTVYTVKGRPSWGHCLKIYDASGNEVGTVKQRVLTFLPTFEIYYGDRYAGCISKEFALFRHSYNIECNGWHVEGNFLEWDYNIEDSMGNTVATVAKELFRMTDTYVIDVRLAEDALCALMLVLAIDAEKCSRN